MALDRTGAGRARRARAILLGAALGAAGVARVSAQTEGCTHTDALGHVYDISNMDNPTAALVADLEQWDGAWLYMNPCTPLAAQSAAPPLPTPPMPAACVGQHCCIYLVNSTQETYSCGANWAMVARTQIVDSQAVFGARMTGGAAVGGWVYPDLQVSSTVSFECNANLPPVTEQPALLRPAPSDEFQEYVGNFNLTVQTSSICDGFVPPPRDAPPPGWSFGSGFMLAFAIGVAVYCVCGSCYRHFKFSLQCPDSIPHFQFWQDLPALVDDGFRFALSKVGLGSGNSKPSSRGSINSGYSEVEHDEDDLIEHG